MEATIGAARMGGAVRTGILGYGFPGSLGPMASPCRDTLMTALP